jgi:uncharacterized protein (TIGR02284 family)
LDKDIIGHLKTLHTSEIDARNGYEEALEDAKGQGMTPLFSEMIALHASNAEELGNALREAGQKADGEGSFMSVVHRTIMDVRSLFNGLDGSVLPGLIDGETRNVAKYNDALQVAAVPAAVASMLTAQRRNLQQKIALMQSQKSAYQARHAAAS